MEHLHQWFIVHPSVSFGRPSVLSHPTRSPRQDLRSGPSSAGVVGEAPKLLRRRGSRRRTASAVGGAAALRGLRRIAAGAVFRRDVGRPAKRAVTLYFSESMRLIHPNDLATA